MKSSLPVLLAVLTLSTGPAPAAMDEAQVAQRLAQLEKPLRRVSQAQAGKEAVDFASLVDWRTLGREIAAFGAQEPALADDRLRVLAAQFLARADRYAPAVAEETRSLLKAGPNVLLRELALAGEALADARRRPVEMRFTALDGREVDLARLRGKVVLVDFWAARWCGACKVELPRLKAAYARYHVRGFEVIGIACEMKESDRQFLVDYVAKNEMPWPQYFDGKGMNNEYARRFGFTAIPQYLLLDQRGRLVSHTQGSGGLRGLERLLRELLGLLAPEKTAGGKAADDAAAIPP